MKNKENKYKLCMFEITNAVYAKYKQKASLLQCCNERTINRKLQYR